MMKRSVNPNGQVGSYKKHLREQFWAYAKNHALVGANVLDRDKPSLTRPPVFKKHEAWRNIILPTSVDCSTKRNVMSTLPEAKRHRWFGSMNSSQALAQSVFGNLIASENIQLLSGLLDDNGLPAFFPEIGDAALWLEHDVKTLNEPRPTSVDVWICGEKTIAVECKLTEAEFGMCSRTKLNPDEEPDYCNGSYSVQMNRDSRCALTEKDIQYWHHIPHLFNWPADQDMRSCAFGANYQLVRNVLAACVNSDGSVSTNGRHTLVIYDERNPAFQSGGLAHKQWHETIAALKYPDLLRRCSWQRLAGLLANESTFEWLVEKINEKYGVAPK